jgi:hypothetical protein
MYLLFNENEMQIVVGNWHRLQIRTNESVGNKSFILPAIFIANMNGGFYCLSKVR